MKYNPHQILADHKKDVGFIFGDLDTATAYKDKLYSVRQYLLELQRTLPEELPKLTEEKLKEYQDDFDSTATEATELWRDFEMAIDTVNDRISCLEEDDIYFINREKLYTEEESIARKWEPILSKRKDELYCETEDYQCSDVIENIQGFFNDVVFFYRRDKDGVDYCDVIYKGETYSHPLDTHRNRMIQEKKAMNENKKNSIPENAIPILSLIGKPADIKVETPPETIAAVPEKGVTPELAERKRQFAMASELNDRFVTVSKARKDVKERAIKVFNDTWPLFTSLAKSAHTDSDNFERIKKVFESHRNALQNTRSDKSIRNACKTAARYMLCIAASLKESVDNLSKTVVVADNETPIDKLEFPRPVMPHTDADDRNLYPRIEDRVPELITAGEWLSQQSNPYQWAEKYFMVIDAVVDDSPTHYQKASELLMSAYTRVSMKYTEAETEEEIKSSVLSMVAALKDFERDVEAEKTPVVEPVGYVFKHKSDRLFDTTKYYTALISVDDVAFISTKDVIGVVVNGADAVAYVVDKDECVMKNVIARGYLVSDKIAKVPSDSVFEVYTPSNAPDDVGYLHMFHCVNRKPCKEVAYLMRPTPLPQETQRLELIKEPTPEPDTPTPAPIVPAEVIDVRPEPAPERLTIVHETPWYVIRTPKKPDAKTIAAIKKAGFYWYGVGKCWSLNEKRASLDKLDTLKQLKAFGGDKDAASFHVETSDGMKDTLEEIQERACDKLLEGLNNSKPVWLNKWFSVVPWCMSYIRDTFYSIDNHVLLHGHSDYYLTYEHAQEVATLHGHSDPGLVKGAPHGYIFVPRLVNKNPDDELEEYDTSPIVNVTRKDGTVVQKKITGYVMKKVYAQHFFNPEAVPIKKLREFKLFDHDRDTEAEKIVSQFITKHNVRLNEIEGSASPTTTFTNGVTVNMPSIRQFKTSVGYYSVLFHELTHAANFIRGCQLTRDREELSAEIGSWIVLNTLGFHADEIIGDVADYCKRYLKVANEKRAMRKAFSHAKDSANLILAPVIEKIKHELEQGVNHN